MWENYGKTFSEYMYLKLFKKMIIILILKIKILDNIYKKKNK